MEEPKVRKRLLFSVSSLSAGGAERVISELAGSFAETGWEVGVLTLGGQANDHYTLHPEVEHIALDLIWDSRNLWQSVVSNVRRSRIIRQAAVLFSPQVVISFIDQNNVRLLAALRGSGIPVIVSERIDPRRHPVGRSWALARRVLYPLAARVVVQTESVAQWAARIVPRSRVRVVPNFVRELPLPILEGREAAHLLAVGRLDRQKGFDVLLTAFARADLMPRGVRLTILGEGPERATLQALARKLGIAEAVHLPGVVKDPETWMARCTAFVLPSRYEGFPNALVEAMAMGCPTIASDCDSGPREIVRHEIDGLLVPPEDSEALARALVRLFDDSVLRGRLGRRAIEIRNRFVRERILGQWEALIEEIMEDKQRM